MEIRKPPISLFIAVYGVVVFPFEPSATNRDPGDDATTFCSWKEFLNKAIVFWLERRALRAQWDTEGADRCKGFEKPVIGFDRKAPDVPVDASHFLLGVITPFSLFRRS